MAHHESDSTAMPDVLRILSENGLDGMARAIEVLMNEAMRSERSEFLGASPHQRTETRRGHANGFKSKDLKTRFGELALAIPQVRNTDEPFYPISLERGLRSERALKLAVAEMYVQGVSTRKVKAVCRTTDFMRFETARISRR